MRDRTLLPVLGLCLLVATTAYLMVFTLLGQIGATLGASRTALDWITIATVIVGTVSSALMPALAAVLGARRLMVISMGCLAAGSLASALAPDVAVLLVGRVVAAPGLAAAALSIAIVRQRRSGPGLARALGVIAAFEGAAAGTGFALGGVVEEAARADWRSVFLAMAAISAVAAAMAAVTVPDGPVPADGAPAPAIGAPAASGDERGPGAVHRHLDLGGAALLAAGLAAGLLAITEGAAWGWTSARTAGLIAAAAALLAVWAVGALRSADPLVRLQVLARPGVAVGAALILVTACSVGIVNLTVPSFLEAPPAVGYGDGASVLTAGLDMLPFAVAITLAGYLAGRLAQLVGLRRIGASGLCAEALGLGLLAGFPHSAGQITAFAAIIGVGHGCLIAAAYIAITQDVPRREAGAAAGFGSAVSGVSGAVASAVITPILAGPLPAGPSLLPAPSGYTRSWLYGAAFAAGAALIVSAARRTGAGRKPAPVRDDAAEIPVG